MFAPDLVEPFVGHAEGNDDVHLAAVGGIVTDIAHCMRRVSQRP